jgi:hypothetical protein
MTDSGTSAEVVRWYTRARRFPQLIGRTPDGTRIPFGPFTFTQVIGVGVFLFVAMNTVSLWGRFDVIGNAVVLATTTLGLAFGLGRIPVGARNPLSLLEGTLRALSAPGSGTVNGRPVRGRTAHRVRSVIVIHQPQPCSDEARLNATGQDEVGHGEPRVVVELDAYPVVSSAAGSLPSSAAADPAPLNHISTPPPATPGPGPDVAATETAVSPRRSGRPLTGVQRLLAEGPHRSRKAA